MSINDLRLLPVSEFEQVRALLPAITGQARPQWRELVDRAGFEFRSDLHYFDLIDVAMLAGLPSVLSDLEESNCFVFNYERLFTSEVEAAFEITRHTAPEKISAELQAGLRGENKRCESLLSIFYLVGLHGIVAGTGNWCILAETDDRAAFLSSQEITYARFLKNWWTLSCQRLDRNLEFQGRGRMGD